MTIASLQEMASFKIPFKVSKSTQTIDKTTILSPRIQAAWQQYVYPTLKEHFSEEISSILVDKNIRQENE